MPSKIETSLTPEQLHEFLRRALQLKGTKLKDIKALAEEFGIEISLMSARTFRLGKFAAHLERIERAKEQIDQLKAVMADGTDTIDASLKIAAAGLLDQMTSGDEVDLVEVSKIIQRLMTSREKREKIDMSAAKLEADLRLRDEQVAKLSAEREEREARKKQLQETIAQAKSKGAITRETLERIEQEAKLL